MHLLPFIFSDEHKYRIRRHVAFWTTWWMFQGVLYSFVAINSANAYVQRLPMALLESAIFLIAHMFLAYSLIYIVIPKFILKQRWAPAIAWTIFFIFLSAFLSALLAIFVINPLRNLLLGDSYIGPSRTVGVSIFLSLMAGLRGGITIGGFAAAIKLMKSLYLKEQRNLQLQKENVESQLKLLTAQVHPHFLFNTLNNIYSHTQNTSPTASKLVSGLSGILRFILYESNQPRVPLSKELQLMKEYMELENIRYSNKLDLHIDVPEDTSTLYIAPLLLLPLVENSFKHGTSRILEHPWISLQVTLEGSEMQMKLINSKTNEVKDGPSGIGIQNVRKRLELLYPNKHQFQIISDEDVFVVKLKLTLERKKEPRIKNGATGAASALHDGSL